MIDRATIDKIMNRVDVVEVIQDFVSLKRAGTNYKGCCPFHNEKTPSFVVSPAKGIYKCFGCGKSGNAINFIMDNENMTYPEALKYLAKKYGIEIVEKELSQEEKQVQSDRESMLVLTQYAAEQFAHNLTETEEGRAIGLSYFRERGITDDAIKEFGLGYSMEGWTAFTDKALHDGYKLEFLTKTGLTSQHDDKKYDKFRGRVMFPIQDISGRVIGFGGRLMNFKKGDSVGKYLNSPESEIYHKSYTLYGLYQARREISKLEKCYLVEGYMDVISFHMAGIKNTVASSGTSLTEEQVLLIRRLTPNVTVLYDGDSAGIHAALRGIDMLLKQGLNVKVLLLPDDEDPDSFAKKYGSEATIKYIEEHEEDFITFKTRILGENVGNDIHKKSEMIDDIAKTISCIEDSITRQLYIQNIYTQLNVTEESLYQRVEKHIKTAKEEARKKQSRQNEREIISSNDIPQPVNDSIPQYVPETETAPQHTANTTSVNPFEAPEKELIYILMTYGEKIIKNPFNDEDDNFYSVKDIIINILDNDNYIFHNADYRLMYSQIKEDYINGRKIEFTNYSLCPNPDISRTAANINTQNFDLSEMWERHGSLPVPEEYQIGKLISDAIINNNINILKEKKKELTNKLTQLQNEKNNFIAQKLSLVNSNSDDETTRNEISHIESQIARIESERMATIDEFIRYTNILNDFCKKAGRAII